MIKTTKSYGDNQQTFTKYLYFNLYFANYLRSKNSKTTILITKYGMFKTNIFKIQDTKYFYFKNMFQF